MVLVECLIRQDLRKGSSGKGVVTEGLRIYIASNSSQQNINLDVHNNKKAKLKLQHCNHVETVCCANLLYSLEKIPFGLGARSSSFSGGSGVSLATPSSLITIL